MNSFVTERKRDGFVAPLTANGTSSGLVTINSSFIKFIFVKQQITLLSNTQPKLTLEVKRVISPTQFYVGPVNGGIGERTNISAYLVSDGAQISVGLQDRPNIKPNDIMRSVYAEEPAVAIRTLSVDYLGRPYDVDNPVPVRLSDGSISIGTVNAELEVQLSHLDNFVHPGDIADSVRIGDGTNTMTGSVVSAGRYALDVLPSNALVKKRYDSIVVTARNLDGDPTQIEFRLGSTVVQTLNISYNLDGDIDSVVSSI